MAVEILTRDARCTWQLIGDIFMSGPMKILMNFWLGSSELLTLLSVSNSKCSTELQSGKLCVGSEILLPKLLFFFCEIPLPGGCKKAFFHFFRVCGKFKTKKSMPVAVPLLPLFFAQHFTRYAFSQHYPLIDA